MNDGQTIKLERDVETNIYDMNNYFKPALARYVQQSGPKPSPEVIIAFGQQFTKDRDSLNNLLVCASVVHTEAFSKLTQVYFFKCQIYDIIHFYFFNMRFLHEIQIFGEKSARIDACLMEVNILPWRTLLSKGSA